MVRIKLSNASTAPPPDLALYIPHGSDKMFDPIDGKYEVRNFISHMVQIKFPSLWSGCWLSILYIPHGSDKIVILPSVNSPPHRLYIPHGSDKINKSNTLLSYQ